MKPAEYYIDHLNLLPHPEGGFYKETYRDSLSVINRVGNERSVSTGIYFMLTKGNFSAFHRIESDEMWHYYEGESLTVYVIDDSGKLEEIKLGKDLENGEQLQAVVPAGQWFASRINQGEYSLVGCTVAPGFDFQDFEMADRETLIKDFPRHSEIITELTRP
jgi:uncharacterized protein